MRIATLHWWVVTSHPTAGLKPSPVCLPGRRSPFRTRWPKRPMADPPMSTTTSSSSRTSDCLPTTSAAGCRARSRPGARRCWPSLRMGIRSASASVLGPRTWRPRPVWRLPRPYRGRGYGPRVTVAWAEAIWASGRVPLYSTSWDNKASLAVARKLGLAAYASGWSLSD